MSVYQIPSYEKKFEICTFQSHFAFFSLSSKFFNLLAILSSLETTLCDKTIKRVLKWFILAI